MDASAALVDCVHAIAATNPYVRTAPDAEERFRETLIAKWRHSDAALFGRVRRGPPRADSGGGGRSGELLTNLKLGSIAVVRGKETSEEEERTPIPRAVRKALSLAGC